MSNCEHVNDDRAADAHWDDIDGPAADWTPGGDGDDAPDPAPEPGACPFCDGNIRRLKWFYHCTGCGFNWSNLAQIDFDRNGVESRRGNHVQ